MALDFPTSPSPNQVYTAGAKSWSWDNTSGAWLAVNAGIQGTQGTQGTLGTQGAQGLQGITGANGSNGSQGIQGIQGTEGTAGFVGSNGAQGTQGIQGTQGTQGTQGIQGLKGTKITPGDTAPASPSENDLWWDSTNGILMVYYNDGTSAQWVTANSGIAGEQGIQGTQGTQGVQGTQGTQGIQGLQGVQGTQGTQGVQGIQGITGLAFTIAKTYLSVAALTADTSPTAIVAGQFALINTTNVEDAENSRLYIWTGSAYTFVDDLSGSAGIQGITGSQGVQGIQGIQGIQGTQGTQGTQGIQGVQGTQGTQGIQGISGASILGTNNTFTGTNAFSTLSATGSFTTSAGSISALAGELQVGSASKMIYLRTLSGSNRIDSYNNPITATVPLFINASTTSIGSDGTTVVISSTGAAITGTLSSTTGANFATSSGSVGIGTSSPTEKLQVAGNARLGTGAFLSFPDSGGALVRFANGEFIATTGQQLQLCADNSDGTIAFCTTSTGSASRERARIDSNGNVGIGTASPGANLHIRGSATGSLTALQIDNSSSAGIGNKTFFNIFTYDGSQYRGGKIYSSVDGAGWTDVRLTLQSQLTGGAYDDTLTLRGGNVGIGTTSPDQPLAFADTVGTKIQFNGANANGYQLGLASAVDGGDAMMKFTAGETSAGEFGFYNTTNARLFINNSGNVGIGTTSPQNKLHVINGSANSSGDGLTVATLHVTGPNVLTTTSNATLIVATNDALGIDIGGSIGFAGRYSGTSQFTAAQISGRKEDATSGNYGGYLAFCTRAHGTQLSEKVRISGSGNLLVGTTNPDPTSTGSSGRLVVQTANGGQAALTAYNIGTGATNIISLENGNGQVGRIQINGSATSYLTSSDSRLKENVKPVTDSSDIIDGLSPKKFDWKTGGKNAYGFIAQEAITVFPEAVSAGDSENEIKSPWAMDYSKLVPVLVAELQSLRKRLAALEAK